MSGHSRFSPSSRYRWRACPGSVRLIEELGVASQSSVYADEGLMAHAQAAMLLATGDSVDDADPAVQEYVEWARSQPGVFHVEHRLEKGPVSGTPDLIIDNYPELTVVDFKNGSGVLVPAEENLQLQTYAVLYAGRRRWKTVRLVIVQPNHEKGGVQVAEYPGSTLKTWQQELADDVARVDIAPELKPGNHCQFCPAKAHCPRLNALTSQAKEAIGPVETLRPEQIVWVLEHRNAIEGWLKAVYQYALANPEKAPGFKVVESIGNRKWVDEALVIEELEKEGVGVDIHSPRKLLSPAQVEKQKLLPKTAVSELTVRPVTGVALVSESDPRPPVDRLSVFNQEE